MNKSLKKSLNHERNIPYDDIDNYSKCILLLSNTLKIGDPGMSYLTNITAQYLIILKLITGICNQNSLPGIY